MRGKKYLWTLAVVYLAYMTHGIQAIVLSQNLDAFAQQWACGTAGVYTAISFTGLAKFLTVWICGELSDKIGRRPMALIGGIMYVVFFGGCLLTRNFTLACVFAFMAGAATSFFDGSLYAAAQESWPKATGTSVILIKGFISISGLIYPMLVVSLRASGAWIVGLIIPIVMSVLLLIITFIAPFSYDDELKQRKLSGWKPATAADKLDADARAAADRFKTPAPKWLVVPLAVMGFINMCTMYSAQQLLNRYGLTVVGMSDMASASLTSLYTGGSLCAVLIWALLMSKFRWRTLKILIIDLAGSVISYAIVISTKSQAIVMIAAFTIGFFAAGGALQCGVSLIQEFHPGPKGRNLGIYYTFMGCASYVMPSIQAFFTSNAGEAAATRINLSINMGLGALGLIFCVFLAANYKKWFGVSTFVAKTPEEIY